MSFEFILASCGTPSPALSGFGSAYILKFHEKALMFDCGPASTHKMVKAGVNPAEVEYLFFTHHHYDHNADYACFLLCRWDHALPGSRPLSIYGPPPTADITEKLVGQDGAYAVDWKARCGHEASRQTWEKRGGDLPRPAPAFEVTDIAEPGMFLETGSFRVRAQRAPHVQPWLESLSYRVDFSGGSVAVSGDCGYCADFVELAKGADLMVANLWDVQEKMTREAAQGLMGSEDAGRAAREAGVKTLLLAHQGPGLTLPGIEEKVVSDAAGHFNGRIIFGRELGCYRF